MHVCNTLTDNTVIMLVVRVILWQLVLGIDDTKFGCIFKWMMSITQLDKDTPKGLAKDNADEQDLTALCELGVQCSTLNEITTC